MAVAVLAVARTAVRPVEGELAGWNPVMLAGVVGCEALERAGLADDDLDEVVVGCADPVGACGADAARAIVLAAGWPDGVGGHVVDRGETSGLAAVQAAAASIRAGQARTVLVVGLGLCSVVPPGAAALNRTYGAPWGGVAERFADRGGLLPGPRLAERAAQAAGIGRAELDAAAEESRRRRAEAGASPAIVAVAARPGDAAGRGVYRGDPVAADVVRSWGDTAELPPAFDDDGLLTAATFAPPADGVAAVDCCKPDRRRRWRRSPGRGGPQATRSTRPAMWQWRWAGRCLRPASNSLPSTTSPSSSTTRPPRCWWRGRWASTGSGSTVPGARWPPATRGRPRSCA